MITLAIDPGTTESGYAYYDDSTGLPSESGKIPNDIMLSHVYAGNYDRIAVEMVAHYGLGMPAGKTIFETCVWIGRFQEAATRKRFTIVYRKEVTLHMCGSVRGKDANVRQSIMDRHGGDRSIAVGVKANPGPLYGFKADAWQALGVAITASETKDF